MIRVAVALLTLSLPLLAGAEEIYRWQDASGGLHYSNQPAHVPSDATVLRTPLDVVHGTPAAVPAARRPEARGTAPARPSNMQNVGACGSAYPYLCPHWQLPYLLSLNGQDIADQVKEASILDALHVPWRGAGCP
jgi:uncharacterized protein DUF4124